LRAETDRRMKAINDWRLQRARRKEGSEEGTKGYRNSNGMKVVCSNARKATGDVEKGMK
jgi:hypothetical protein